MMYWKNVKWLLVGAMIVFACCGPVTATTFSDATSWWRARGYHDDGQGADSAFTPYLTVAHSVSETIPGEGSNNLLLDIAAGSSVYVAAYAGASNEYAPLTDDLTTFSRFRFDSEPADGWQTLLKKYKASNNALFVQQYLTTADYWRFGYCYGAGTLYVGDATNTTFEPTVGTWYDMVGVFKEGPDGYLRVVLTETATGQVIFDHQVAANTTNVNNIGPYARMRFAHGGLGDISMESAAVWGSALSGEDIAALTPEPATLAILLCGTLAMVRRCQ